MPADNFRHASMTVGAKRPPKRLRAHECQCEPVVRRAYFGEMHVARVVGIAQKVALRGELESGRFHFAPQGRLLVTFALPVSAMCTDSSLTRTAAPSPPSTLPLADPAKTLQPFARRNERGCRRRHQDFLTTSATPSTASAIPAIARRDSDSSKKSHAINAVVGGVR